MRKEFLLLLFFLSFNVVNAQLPDKNLTSIVEDCSSKEYQFEIEEKSIEMEEDPFTFALKIFLLK